MIWAVSLIVCVLVICLTVAFAFWTHAKSKQEKQAVDLQRFEAGLTKIANIESRVQALELQRSTSERTFR